MPALELKGVSKSFGGRKILYKLDLSLEPGRILVVVGPSGGGKSVLLDLLLGLLQPDEGEVIAPSEVGMVFQDGALFDDLSVKENLAFPIRGQDQEERVKAAAIAVGLSPGHLAAWPSQLSGGLRKRAAIARALVQGPPILLYDEPTSGLDGAAAARISAAILTARAAQPEQAALVVSHDYVLSAQVADEILYLDPIQHRLLPLISAEELEGPRDWRALRDRLENHFQEQDPPASEPGTQRRSLLAALRGQLSLALESLRLLTGIRLPKTRPFLRRFWELGLSSAPAVAVSGLVLGLVTALQTGQALGLAFGDLDPLPALLGAIICHHLGPLYTGLFLAGRVGARVASEVGIKTYLRQADALQTFGTTAEAVWLSPMMAASLFAFPLMALLLEATGILGGFLSYVWIQGQNTAGFYHTVLSDVALEPILWGLLRALVTGIVVITLAYTAGRQARRGSDAVGRATTQAVVSGLLGAIAVELLFSLLGGL